MSTAMIDKSVTYRPFGEREEITLSFGQVKNFISAKTRKGMVASDADIVKFIMLCKARELNPWVGDAYLVGYDGQDGPSFSLITSLQALFKRAEANPAFDGLQSGVIVRQPDGTILEREGDFVLPNENLLGGWAKCYRKDRKVPFYDALNLSTYDKGRSQWDKDKSGMICKTAEASVLRKAFPSQLSSLYIQQEEAAIVSGGVPADSLNEQQKAVPKTLSDMARLVAPATTQTYTPKSADGDLERMADDLEQVTQPRSEQDKQQPSAKPAKKQRTLIEEPEQHFDPLGLYLSALATCQTEAQCRDAYEKHGHPDHCTWASDDHARAVRERDSRIAAVRKSENSQ